MSQFWPTERFFEVKPPSRWGTDWNVPQPVVPQPKPIYADNEELKKLFGIELAKDHPNTLAAAIVVFGEDTNAALWVSNNWMHDPIVLGSRDLYRKTIETEASLLDKSQLAAKLLKFSDEKNHDGTRYLCEARERLNALRLYSDIMGWTGRAGDVSVNNSFAHNEMQIKFITAEVKEQIKTINQNDEETTICGTDEDIEPLPINLKLISGTG